MSFYNSLTQETLADLLRAYDCYISTAADAGLLSTGWTPVFVQEFYDCEYQEVWDPEQGDKSFYYMYENAEKMATTEDRDLIITLLDGSEIWHEYGQYQCQFPGEEVMRPIRSDIRDIEAGDAFIVGTNIYCAQRASHQNLGQLPIT